MNKPLPEGESMWKGLVILVGVVLIGLVVFTSFDKTPSALSAGQGPDQPKGPTSTVKPGVGIATTTSSIPLKDNGSVKVLIANATSASGATKKVVDALKPACYVIAGSVDALAKVKAENRATSTVYSTTGFEREAALIATKLGLQASANAALPPESPIPTKGQPTFNVLILVAKDLVDKPPEPLPGAQCGLTTTTKASSTGKTTVKPKSASTTSKATTTIRSNTTVRATTTTDAPG